MASAKVGPVSLYYEELGKGAAVIFVHGIPTDYRIWNYVANELSRDFRAIAYSRRCAYPNQNSTDPSESTIEANSADLVNLIRELEIQDAILVGHSYGGFVSLFTAWKNPELVKTLVLAEPAVPSVLVRDERNPVEALGFLLSDPGAALSARKFQRVKLGAALKAYESGDYISAARNFYDGIREQEGAFDHAAPEVKKMMIDNGRTVGELETTFPVFTKSDARTIRARVLLVKGAQSPKWLRAIVDGLGRFIPDAKVAEISNAGHLAHADNPAEFTANVRNFLVNYA